MRLSNLSMKNKCELCCGDLLSSDNYYQCNQCLIIIRKERQPYQGSSTTWGNKYVQTYEEGHEWREKIARSRVSLITSVLSGPIHHLDVGGATGILSGCLVEKGFLSHNFEPDEGFFNASKRKRIDTVSNIEHLDDNQYNVITIFDSLGFSRDLEGDLKKIAAKKAENCLIFGSFGYCDNGLEHCPDKSFNYYIHTKAINYIFDLLDCNAYKFWIEDRSFNLIEHSMSSDYWRRKLNLTAEPKMVYCIGLSGNLSETLPKNTQLLWNMK